MKNSFYKESKAKEKHENDSAILKIVKLFNVVSSFYDHTHKLVKLKLYIPFWELKERLAWPLYTLNSYKGFYFV